MSDGLLPCPFCGGEASDAGYVYYSKPCTETRWEDGSPVTEAFFCNCPRCGITNMATGMGYRTKARAIAAWNRRALPAAERAEDVRAGAQDQIARLAREIGEIGRDLGWHRIWERSDAILALIPEQKP